MTPPPLEAGLLLLIGGARSGKSRLASALASRWPGPVTVLATAQAGDEDMAARIARHRQERPDHWSTVEEPTDIATAIRDMDPAACVVLDCVTLWVANLLGSDHTAQQAVALAGAAGDAAAARSSPVIVVTNEVGAGVVPPTRLGRDYRDCLGEVNQVWAAAARRVLLVVAGRVVELGEADPRWGLSP